MAKRSRSISSDVVVSYVCAFIGHVLFQKNRPATSSYPLYALMGDCVMWGDIVTGRIKL